MGIDYHTYLGPYSETYKQPHEEQVPVKGCPKCATQIYTLDIKFCQSCGTAIGTFNITKIVTISPWPIQEKIQERLSHISSMTSFNSELEYWVPNVNFISRKTHIEYRNSHVVPVHVETIASELKLYESFFSKELAVLYKEYGTLRTVWGLLVWQS